MKWPTTWIPKFASRMQRGAARVTALWTSKPTAIDDFKANNPTVRSSARAASSGLGSFENQSERREGL